MSPIQCLPRLSPWLSMPPVQSGSRPPCFSLPRKWTKPRKRASSIVSQASNSLGCPFFNSLKGPTRSLADFEEDEDLFFLPVGSTGRQTLDEWNEFRDGSPRPCNRALNLYLIREALS